MCGRFTQFYTWQEIRDLYGLIGSPPNLEPRYNIAPTDTIDVVLPTTEGLGLEQMPWGLVPAWWEKSLKELPATFNARAETVATKPMFRFAFGHGRCIIPASGFYEWKTIEGKKQPFHFTEADGGLLSITGLWDRWKDPASGAPLRSATIIVTAANDFMAKIHNRMPMLLSGEAREAWLSGAAGTEVLRPAPEGYLCATPVSMKVNSVRNQGAELVKPVELPAAK